MLEAVVLVFDLALDKREEPLVVIDALGDSGVALLFTHIRRRHMPHERRAVANRIHHG
mgnify:CR=1 FL=1